MIRFYGFNISNYCNMVKMALLEKDCDFEFVETYPSDAPAFLAQSGSGKLPYLEVEGGFICETNVILEYLEETQGGVSLLPEDALGRARVRELCKLTELYLELPARRCYGQLYFGGDALDEATRAEVRQVLERGVRALNNRASFTPYLAGDRFSLADIVFLYTMDLAVDAAGKILDWDLWTAIPGSRELWGRLNATETARRIALDRKDGWAAYRAHFG